LKLEGKLLKPKKKKKVAKKYIETPEELYNLFGVNKEMVEDSNANMTPISLLDYPNCPSCGLSLDDLNFYGKLGCAECYEHFSEEVIPLLMSFQRSKSHKGKIPKSFAKKKTKEELQDLINLAISEENYEAAAQFKKELDQLNDV
jgi:protein-arginine kinase activator protein McsA